MAIAQNGPGGHHNGKLGKLVYYTLNGIPVAREIGVSNKPFTPAQLQHQLLIKIRSELFSTLLDFINVGFSVEGGLINQNGFNTAIKNNLRVVKGTFPKMEIAFDQIMVSKGSLKPVENWKVTPTRAGLEYTWDKDPQMAWPDSTDQVMLLAYFPKQEKAFHTLFGNTRSSGSDVLEIPLSLQGERMETYMAFISADRKRMSDSIYTGSFNTELTEKTTLTD
jgi:hypothetical protein